MIEAIDLTVHRRGRTVLDAVSFDVRPGQVTGVLGGTAAGKTVLLRRMVGLERGRGETLFGGRPYHALRHPMREVGLLLDPMVGDPDRTVRGLLRLALATDRGAARGSAMAGVRQASGGEPADDGDRRGRKVGHADGPDFHGRSVGERDDDDRHEDDREPGCEDGAGNDPDDERDTGNDPDYERDTDHERDGRRRGLGRIRGRDRGRDRGRERERVRGSSGGSRSGGDRSRDETRLRDKDLRDRIDAGRRGRPGDRIDAVLDIVGLGEHGRTRLAELTEGMATRLGIAVALLGDPKTLLLDCPDRGLEPEGVAWLGALLRAFTAQGRAALVTGSDTETLVGMVDRVLLLDSGYLVGTRTAEEVLRAPTGASVVVRSPQIVRFAAILAEAGARSTQGEGACLEVRGLDRARVGDLAYRHGIAVHELSDRFTGSDAGDRVLAACTRRRARPAVPIQGSPDGKRVLGVPVSVNVTLGRVRAPGVRTVGLDAAGVDGVGVNGVGVRPDAVRPGTARFDSSASTGSVRLITVLPEPEPAVQREPTDSAAAAAAADADAAPAVDAADHSVEASTNESAEHRAQVVEEEAESLVDFGPVGEPGSESVEEEEVR